ncbi:MAG: hypothetical protein AUI14_21930 [Actinobacteria bacterium 13_2_20CM_2_71_6]|nr:MAG: hypothetical protein AUI14_21930 [Actinobacteria bacterium 13_2_20CM_2_71_6]
MPTSPRRVRTYASMYHGTSYRRRVSSTASAAPASPATASPTPTGYPKTGPGTWRYATAHGAILGTAGPVRHFRVAVETGIPIDVDAFADEVEDTLGDGRSWIAGGQFRLQRVPGNASSEFTVYLATKGTSVKLCQAGGVATGGFTSCRTPGHVVINLDRWVNAVPEYVNAGVPLETYRKYVINHETGHQLGHGHELCPGAGRPAPVMEQQTLGLHGCTANPWPYLDGERYAGPPGHY